MFDMVQQTAAWLPSQRVGWSLAVAMAVAMAVILGRSLLRYAAFLCGMAVAIRGTHPDDRPAVLHAYSTCTSTLYPRFRNAPAHGDQPPTDAPLAPDQSI